MCLLIYKDRTLDWSVFNLIFPGEKINNPDVFNLSVILFSRSDFGNIVTR